MTESFRHSASLPSFGVVFVLDFGHSWSFIKINRAWYRGRAQYLEAIVNLVSAFFLFPMPFLLFLANFNSLFYLKLNSDL